MTENLQVLFTGIYFYYNYFKINKFKINELNTIYITINTDTFVHIDASQYK